VQHVCPCRLAPNLASRPVPRCGQSPQFPQALSLGRIIGQLCWPIFLLHSQASLPWRLSSKRPRSSSPTLLMTPLLPWSCQSAHHTSPQHGPTVRADLGSQPPGLLPANQVPTCSTLSWKRLPTMLVGREVAGRLLPTLTTPACSAPHAKCHLHSDPTPFLCTFETCPAKLFASQSPQG
jgi:hypothetical protein